MKGVWVGKFELEKYGIEKIINILVEYEFDTVYFISEPKGFNQIDARILKDAGFKVFLTLNFGDHSVEELINLIDYNLDVISGVCFDYIRCKDEDFGIKGLFSHFELYRKAEEVKKAFSLYAKEWHCVFKCEDYTSLLRNEAGRLMWGQAHWFMGSLFNKILLMAYHQCYNVEIRDVFWLVKGLQKWNKKFTPIFQTYQDKPVVDYNIYWEGVQKISKFFPDKAYFRLGTCDLLSFT